jgi:hypothetical protein
MAAVPAHDDVTDFPFHPGHASRRARGHLTRGILQTDPEAVKHLTAGPAVRIKVG